MFIHSAPPAGAANVPSMALTNACTNSESNRNLDCATKKEAQIHYSTVFHPEYAKGYAGVNRHYPLFTGLAARQALNQERLRHTVQYASSLLHILPGGNSSW